MGRPALRLTDATALGIGLIFSTDSGSRFFITAATGLTVAASWIGVSAALFYAG